MLSIPSIICYCTAIPLHTVTLETEDKTLTIFSAAARYEKSFIGKLQLRIGNSAKYVLWSIDNDNTCCCIGKYIFTRVKSVHLHRAHAESLSETIDVLF